MIKAVLRSDPKFMTTIDIEKHVQILDEPISLGGNNQGPTPVQSVYAALASCICITVRIYADGKKIPLERIDAQIEASKKPVEKNDERFRDHPDMIDKGKVRFIHARIHVYGKLNPEQVDKLHVIAGKCPVHKMLKQGAYITHETLHIMES